MKKNLLFWLTIIMMLVSYSEIQAQYAACTPNPLATDPEGNGEIDPDALPISFIGEGYDAVLTTTPPPSGSGFDVTKIQIDYLENLPAGFYWETNSGNADDYMYVENWYCVAITGMPEGPAGIFDVTVYANAWIWLGFFEQEAPGNPQNGGVITAIVCNPLDLELGEDITIMSDETIVFNVDQEDGYHTYLWNDLSVEPNFTFDASVYGPGTHQIIVTIRDTVGTTGIYAGMQSPCFKSDTINITVTDCGSTPFDLGENTSIPHDGEITLDATVEGVDIEYLWNDESTEPSLNIEASELGIGEFTFSVIVTVGECEYSDEITITVVDCNDFNFDLGENITIDDDDEITLDATIEGDDITYLWSDESTEPSLLVDASELGLGEFTFSVMATNGTCVYSDEITITVSDLSNIISNICSLMSIYPNPNNGIFNIVIEEQAINNDLQIININGQIIYSENISNTDNIIDLGNVPAGLYTVKIQNEKNSLSLRFLIQ